MTTARRSTHRRADREAGTAEPRLCLFIPSYGDGGVERMLVNTARGLSALGVPIDLATETREKPFLASLDGTGVRLIELGDVSGAQALEAFSAYIRLQRPDVVLTAKEQASIQALAAREATGVPFKLIIRSGTTVSRRMAHRPFYKRWKTYRMLRRTYPRADWIIANSQGVAEDTARTAGVDRGRLSVILNPVVTPDLYAHARAPVDHPWFTRHDKPIVLGIGGLRRQKNFAMLIRAVAQARKRRDLRLVILGQGRLRRPLQRLAQSLGVAGAVDLIGFMENPYPYIARADVFALSSLWEGSPNVLTEALALGTPAVAADCESGPRETLQDGRYGRLVPVDDADAMAAALLDTLDAPLAPEVLRSAVTGFTMEESARRYRALIRQLAGLTT